MELRKTHSAILQPASTPANWIKRIAIALAGLGALMLILPSLAAYGLKTGFESAMKNGDAGASSRTARNEPAPGSLARPTVPVDPTRYQTPIRNVAGESRILGIRMSRIIFVGIDYKQEAGKPHQLNTTLNLGEKEAAILVSGEPTTFAIQPSNANYPMHLVFEGASPVDLVARDRSVIALRDASLTPMSAIDLETADAATRAPFCATLGRWVTYFGMPLDELTYWYVSDPQSLAVTTIQVRGKSTGFKIFGGPKLKAACPSLKSGETQDRAQAKKGR